jgi:hypothetical protein
VQKRCRSSVCSCLQSVPVCGAALFHGTGRVIRVALVRYDRRKRMRRTRLSSLLWGLPLCIARIARLEGAIPQFTRKRFRVLRDGSNVRTIWAAGCGHSQGWAAPDSRPRRCRSRSWCLLEVVMTPTRRRRRPSALRVPLRRCRRSCRRARRPIEMRPDGDTPRSRGAKWRSL